jgi:sterol desaturase/sphingolipid hydroxylase (fatty acid hydroxylase superfamily)
MTTQEFLGNLAIIGGLMGVLALIEWAVPLFARGERSRGRGAANLGLSTLTLLLNWALISAAALIALRPGAAAHGGVAWLAASVVVLDLATWLAHRTMHGIPFMWRVHSVHHSDPFLDVTTTLRQHPLEGLWRFAWLIGPIWILGLPAAGVVLYRLLSVAQGLLEHANLRVWSPLDRAVSLLWVTPNFHKVHHSRVRAQTDSNYGNLFALFDRAFRTFRPSDEAFDVVYGLDDVAPARAKSLPELLRLPLAGYNRPPEVQWTSRDGRHSPSSR